MSKTTFAQLPGLQKAAQILQLQEQINTHHLYATWLLDEFNINTRFPGREQRASRLQVLCEWHGTQAMYLQCQLDDLKKSSI